MTGLLGHLRVRSKMLILVFVSIASLISMQALSLNGLWHHLNAERQHGLIQLTDMASSLIEHQEKLVSSGQKSKEAGQKDALEDIRTLRYGESEYFFVLDTDHNMLMHPISAKLNGANVASLVDTNGKPMIQDLVSIARNQGAGFVDYFWNRPGGTEPVQKLSYARYHSKWGWIVGTGVYTDDIEATYQNSLWLSIGLLMAALIITGTLSTLITRAIILPVNTLKTTMLKVSETHDLNLRANIQNKDEFGQIGFAFDDMMTNFHDLILDLRSAAIQMSSSAVQLSATTEQTSQGMIRQQAETTQVATAMSEMNATVHDVSKNTQEAATAAHDAAHAAHSGRAIVENSITAVKALSDRLTDSADLTHTLEDESANIASILEVINGIAEQTNLLALNAAIEAARAGEHGRGFAVVADEVRSLSARTAESTQEIRAVIERLQSGTHAAADAMTNSSLEADEVVQQTLKAGDALTQISSAIEEIDSMTIQIASASEQQSAVAEEINQNVLNIDSVSTESSVGASQIAQSSEALAKLAEHLRELAERFSAK